MKDLYWLAGIVDGEGQVNIRNKKDCIAFEITITNKNFGILNKVEEIYKSLGITYGIYEKSGERKDCYDIKVSRKNDCKFLAKILYNLLYDTNKKERAFLMKNTDISRRKDGHKANLQPFTPNKYAEQAIQLIN